jgi:hypothetical protein
LFSFAEIEFMEQQNFKNHSRMAPKAYYVGIALALIVIVFSLIYVEDIPKGWDGSLLPVLFLYLCIGVILIGYYARAFALKAQDRAIRAEENLRHFAMTGKLLDKRLTINQVIALRFAADEEFVSLAQKAADENISAKEIKTSIKNWRADHYRV